MRVCHTCSATDFEESCNSRDHTCTLKSTRMNNLSPFHLLPASDSQANLADFGDNQWVTCFQETAEVLLGHSAETLGQLRDTVRHAHKRYRTLCPVNSFTWLCIYVCVCVCALVRTKLHSMKSFRKPTSQPTSSETESSWRRTT